MQIADPVSKALQRTELVFLVDCKCKAGHVLENRRHDALLRDRTRLLTKAFRITRQVDVVFARTASRFVRPTA
jgi:hypothetical protein